MVGLPAEIWLMILYLAGSQTASRFQLVCKEAYPLAIRPLLRSVDLNRGTMQTVSFCNYILSSQGVQNLHLLRHLTIHRQTFYTPHPLSGPVTHADRRRKVRGDKTPISTAALRLFSRVLDNLAHMKTLRSIRLDDVPDDVVQLPVFDEGSSLLACLKTASFCVQIPCQLRLGNITALSLRVLPSSLSHMLNNTVIFPCLISLTSTLDILEVFSLHHSLKHVVLREHVFRRCRPKWIKSFADTEKLSSALRRIQVQSLALGIAFASQSDEMQQFFDSLVDVAPTIQSLGITLRSARISNTKNTVKERYLIKHSAIATLTNLRDLNRLWVYVTDRRMTSVDWCPDTLRILPDKVCLGRDVKGCTLNIWTALQTHWKLFVAAPKWSTFLLQMDYKGQSCADGWKRVSDGWNISSDESYEALGENMFTQLERSDPSWRDRES